MDDYVMMYGLFRFWEDLFYRVMGVTGIVDGFEFL